jgi:hypothetical protein
MCSSPFLVQSDQYLNAHQELFSGERLDGFTPTYAHLSMTLGFCQEQGYWAPADEISEDYIQSYKAVYMGGESCTKTVWCVNSLGMPLSIAERYKQAKRHKWGITMCCWSFAMLFDSQIEILSNLAVLRQVLKESVFSATSSSFVFITLLPQLIDLCRQLQRESQMVCMVLAAVYYCYTTLMASIREILIWKIALHGCEDLHRASVFRCLTLVLTWPALKPISDLAFDIIPRWHNAIHSFYNHNFHFETTAKDASTFKGMDVESDLEMESTADHTPRICCVDEPHNWSRNGSDGSAYEHHYCESEALLRA